MEKNANGDLVAYATYLEQSIDQLLQALKQCSKLLSLFSGQVHDKNGWLKLINDINDIIQISAESKNKSRH